MSGCPFPHFQQVWFGRYGVFTQGVFPTAGTYQVYTRNTIAFVEKTFLTEKSTGLINKNTQKKSRVAP